MNLVDCESCESRPRSVNDLKSVTVDCCLSQDPPITLGITAADCIERDHKSFGYVQIRLSRGIHFFRRT